MFTPQFNVLIKKKETRFFRKQLYEKVEILTLKEQIRGNVEVKSKDIARKCKRLAKSSIAREIKKIRFCFKSKILKRSVWDFWIPFCDLKSV